MKTLLESILSVSKKYLSEGAGHMATRLGHGSSGVVYDLGNGWVRKTLKLPFGPSKNIRQSEWKITERWAKVKDLKVISQIKNWNGETYDIEKLKCPCKEGEIIERCINNYLFGPNQKSWKQENIQRMKTDIPESEFVMEWLNDFMKDVEKIIGENNVSSFSDDIRSANIGKDKQGNIKCFDWFDPWCTKIRL